MMIVVLHFALWCFTISIKLLCYPRKFDENKVFALVKPKLGSFFCKDVISLIISTQTYILLVTPLETKVSYNSVSTYHLG